MGYLRLCGLCDGFVVHGESQGNFLGRFIHHAAREVLLLTTSWWRVVAEQMITLQMSDCLHNSLQVLPWCACQVQPNENSSFNNLNEGWRMVWERRVLTKTDRADNIMTPRLYEHDTIKETYINCMMNRNLCGGKHKFHIYLTTSQTQM
jgi:hypothetical protein